MGVPFCGILNGTLAKRKRVFMEDNFYARTSLGADGRPSPRRRVVSTKFLNLTLARMVTVLSR